MDHFNYKGGCGMTLRDLSWNKTLYKITNICIESLLEILGNLGLKLDFMAIEIYLNRNIQKYTVFLPKKDSRVVMRSQSMTDPLCHTYLAWAIYT